jgi:hypothetical protein
MLRDRPTVFGTEAHGGRMEVVMAVASLAFWFAVGFPWQHHNESLVWALSLTRHGFLDTLISNPIPSLQTYRPLAVALAWIDFRLAGHEIWLQQLVNFALTVLAWAMALTSVRERGLFAVLSFVCGAVFFSGYIYLFHLHGVFYPPLWLFLAYLLRLDNTDFALDWRKTLQLTAVTLVAALFHTFALLVFAAYIIARRVQMAFERRRERVLPTIVAVCIALGVMQLLLSSAKGFGLDDPWQGLWASFHLMEVNKVGFVVSGGLTILTCVSVGATWRQRAATVAGGLLLLSMLSVVEWPAVIGWLMACILKAALRKRIGLAALIGACALFPASTGSGSPTYAIFILMPCLRVTVMGIAWRLPDAGLFRLALYAVIGGLTAAFFAIDKVELPVVGKAAGMLRAERQKTHQMMNAFTWLELHPEIVGSLELCNPKEAPAKSAQALARVRQSPASSWEFEIYVKERFKSRLSQARPAIKLCFGGESLQNADTLYAEPGEWAGVASLQRLR